jgi:hypothetical protein
MTLPLSLTFYVLAAIPAYLLTRNSRRIWRILVGWLIGFLFELGAVVITFLIVVSTNPETAPLAVAMALVPPLPLLLITPGLGVVASLLFQQLRKSRQRASTGS